MSEEETMQHRFDDGNGTTVEITAPVTNDLGTKDRCFTVIEASGLRVRVTTHRSGRHWVELQEVNRRTTLLGPPGDLGDGDVTVIKTPFTGDVAHNYEPKRRLVAIAAATLGAGAGWAPRPSAGENELAPLGRFGKGPPV